MTKDNESLVTRPFIRLSATALICVPRCYGRDTSYECAGTACLIKDRCQISQKIEWKTVPAGRYDFN
jgi:hypothetical protein